MRTLIAPPLLALAACVQAGEPAAEPPSVVIESIADDPLFADRTLDASELAFARVSSSDTATLLPGVDAAQSGGVAGLPVMNGLADDRVKTVVNGMPLSAACPMHMNPPLSYVDPSGIGRLDALPGVTPVSLGGDSIAGTILVESPPPVFSPDAHTVENTGTLSSFYRSNGTSIGAAAAASMASSDLSLAYQGSGVRSGDYHDGDGELIRASRFATSNQQLTLAWRSGTSLYETQAGVQYMPYEGFPNADMDLSENVGAFVDARYRGLFGWGGLSISGYLDSVQHQMNGNAPDRYPPSPVDITSMGLMPTRERGRDFGYRAELDVARSARDTLRLGNELHTQTLDDRWPGAPVDMPFDYVSLNHAMRTQLGTFAEWERHWDERWSALVGVRNDTVWMNTGPVEGYEGIDATASAFNALARARTDVNFDATLLALYRPDERRQFRLGVSRKNRSPNLYERYAWGTSTIGMITWFGDGNGYTGNPSLKPETAYTVSAAAEWREPTAGRWQVEGAPYYTLIERYIGVLPICGPACSGEPAAQLLFTNQRARLYGFDTTTAYTIASSDAFGVLQLSGAGGFVRGEDLSTHTNLYHMMPLNGTLALEYRQAAWLGRLELRAVERKNEVDDLRLEPPTAGYATVNFRSAYLWRALRLDFAVTNLLDRQYANPLGGSWQSALYPPGYRAATFRPLPAPGRSFDVGVTVKL